MRPFTSLVLALAGIGAVCVAVLLLLNGNIHFGRIYHLFETAGLWLLIGTPLWLLLASLGPIRRK